MCYEARAPNVQMKRETEVYRRYTAEDLAKFYSKGEHALFIFTETEELGKLRQEIDEISKREEKKQLLIFNQF